jgi:hypothetical protein
VAPGYALAFVPTSDRTMATTFNALWDLFGDVGLPEAILCDNAFGSLGRPGLSAFDAKLVRLGIKPLHGRPYHPQTQGKVEAFHGSVMRELVRRHARLDDAGHFAADAEAWRGGPTTPSGPTRASATTCRPAAGGRAGGVVRRRCRTWRTTPARC